jgi:hypothetical protein
MKKLVLYVLIQLVLSGLVTADLVSVYKKGTIKLIADPSYGKGTDWESLFYDSYKNMVVMEDGTVFVSNNRNHNIFKFNPSGQKTAAYGQLGEGPGDLYYPGNLSIMDGRYLVIAEDPLRMRISIFDFSGKCVKIIKSNHSIYRPIALKNNKIAYISISTGNPTKKIKIKSTVFIKDIDSRKEFSLFSAEFVGKNFIMIDNITMFSIDTSPPDLFIKRTLDGNLLVGISNTPDIRIYSPEGNLLRSFCLQIKPVPITGEYIKKFKESYIAYKKEGRSSRNSEWIKRIERLSFSDFFDPYFPLYREILVDAEGNFLVFKSSECMGNCNEIFQVYSPEGKFICETTIDKGNFDFGIGRKFKNIVFTKKAIYGLFELKDSEDVSLRLVKVDLK